MEHLEFSATAVQPLKTSYQLHLLENKVNDIMRKKIKEMAIEQVLHSSLFLIDSL